MSKPAPKRWWTDRQWLLALSVGVALALLAGLLISTALAPVQWVLLLLLYPPLEEYVFRQLIQPLIQRHWPLCWRQLSLANITTSVLFTLAHVAGRGLNLFSLTVFFPSLVFGYFRERHQQLASPIALHMAFNAAFLTTATL